MPLRVVGPLDGRRARRRRCDTCAKRRIRCHGGVPCINCTRTKRDCILRPGHDTLIPVFVGKNASNACEPLHTPSNHVDNCFQLKSLCPKRTERYFSYFFSSFLPANAFTSKAILVDVDLPTIAHSSPALRDAILAIAALYLNRLHLSPSANGDEPSEASVALEAYGRSVRVIQDTISQNTFAGDNSALWVTFLLGLFELMKDSTGTNWLAHFLQGTSIILRLQRPESLLTPDAHNSRRRSFFVATRVFEISRSLIYSSPTFLSRPEWVSTVSGLWDGDFAALWHPKEALFDLLPQVSDLSIRAIQFCTAASQLPKQMQLARAEALAAEGLLLQALLEQWRTNSLAWQRPSQSNDFQSSVHNEPDTEFLVARVYYHATCIYLSGTYDYHSHWTYEGAPCAPILPRRIIDNHVDKILHISHALLTRGIAGVLLFFPLRVAGARAKETRLRVGLLAMLQMISAGGFIVADAFIDDLSTLWKQPYGKK